MNAKTHEQGSRESQLWLETKSVKRSFQGTAFIVGFRFWVRHLREFNQQFLKQAMKGRKQLGQVLDSWWEFFPAKGRKKDTTLSKGNLTLYFAGKSVEGVHWHTQNGRVELISPGYTSTSSSQFRMDSTWQFVVDRSNDDQKRPSREDVGLYVWSLCHSGDREKSWIGVPRGPG